MADPTIDPNATPMDASTSISIPQMIGTAAPIIGAGINSSAIDTALGNINSGITGATNTIKQYAQPYTTTGATANQQIYTGVQPGGQFNKPFTMEDASNSAAEQYALTTGIDALQNSAIGKGGILNTNTIAGLEDFAAKNAAQFQNQAFNQRMAENQLALGALENLSGTGASMAGSVGTNVAGMQTAAAKAAADAAIAKANQLSTGINNATSAYNALKPTTSATGTTGSAQVRPSTGGLPAAGGVGVGLPQGPGAWTQNPNGTLSTKDSNGNTITTDANGQFISATDPSGAPVPGYSPTGIGAPGTGFGGVGNDPSVGGMPTTGGYGTGFGGVGTDPSVGGYPVDGNFIQTVADPNTGLPIDQATGLPLMDVANFDTWFASLMDPTGTLDANVAWDGLISPTNEFTVPTFDPGVFDPGTFTVPDTSTWIDTNTIDLGPMSMDPYSMDSYYA